MADTILQQDGDDLSEQNLAQQRALGNINDYVERGLGFNADLSASTLDIGSGHAIVRDGTQAYDVFPDARSGLGLATASGTNYVYLTIRPGTQDDIRYELKSSQTPPTDPSLLVGTVDAGSDTSTVMNRAPDVQLGETDIERLAAALDANGQDITNAGAVGSDSTETGDLYGEYSQQVRAIVDGETFTYDPESSTNAIQDAIDKCAAENGGVVVRPASLVPIGTTIKPQENVSILGPRCSKDDTVGIEVTTGGISAVDFDGVSVNNLEFDFGDIRGPGEDVASPAAVKLTNNSSAGFVRWGDLRVDRWGGRVWYEGPGSNTYASVGGIMTCGASVDPTTNGDSSVIEMDSLHPPMQWQHITLQSASEAVGIDAIGSLKVGTMGIGEAITTVVRQRDGFFATGWVEYEPEERTTTTNSVFENVGANGMHVWSGTHDPQDAQTTQYWYSFDGGGGAIIGKPVEQTALDINIIDVGTAPSSLSWTFTKSTAVNDRAGANTDNLACFGDFQTTT